MRAGTLAPLGLLLTYGIAFASAALGPTLPAFDDHPGQLYRVWHVVTRGFAPWAWNPGWWTGYPELQFYPPAFAYAGALLHSMSIGSVSVAAAYQALVWIAYLAAGVTAYLLLARLLGSGWLALPGAFLVLTLSLWPHLTSGVEGGVHVGMASARLGWALVPVVILVLTRWLEHGDRFPARVVTPLVAVVALLHPAHLPATVAIVLFAAVLTPPRARRIAEALGWLALAAGLTAFWTLPLLARLEHARALAWGQPALDLRALPLVLTGGALLALRLGRSPGERLVLWLPWLMAGVVLVDWLVLEALGLRWLPAHRVMDSFWLALVLAAGLAAGRLLERAAHRARLARPLLAVAGIAAAVGLALVSRGHDPVLTLWPRASEWPSQAATVRGLRLEAFWSSLGTTPEGRVLFVRSGVPLVFGQEWWRPHTHITALTPLASGRAIVNGTFTHHSPVASLVYRGSADPGPVAELVERLDGRSLFGRPLEALGAGTFNRYADALGVSVVVGLDEDAPRLGFVDDNPRFERRPASPPFLIWTRRAPVALPRQVGSNRWEVALAGEPGAWVSAGLAYYPLWRADAGGIPLGTRRGPLANLEVRLSRPGPVTLTYAPGTPELLGVAISVAGALVWLLGSGLGCRQGAGPPGVLRDP